MCCPQLCSHCGWLLLKCSAIGIGFNGAETNCRIAHILGILLMNSCNTDRFLATTVVCGLSTLNRYLSDLSTKNGFLSLFLVNFREIKCPKFIIFCKIAKINPLTAERALRADFTLSNAGRFYLSMGNPLAGKGLMRAKYSWSKFAKLSAREN